MRATYEVYSAASHDAIRRLCGMSPTEIGSITDYEPKDGSNSATGMHEKAGARELSSLLLPGLSEKAVEITASETKRNVCSEQELGR